MLVCVQVSFWGTSSEIMLDLRPGKFYDFDLRPGVEKMSLVENNRAFNVTEAPFEVVANNLNRNELRVTELLPAQFPDLYDVDARNLRLPMTSLDAPKHGHLVNVIGAVVALPTAVVNKFGTKTGMRISIASSERGLVPRQYTVMVYGAAAEELQASDPKVRHCCYCSSCALASTAVPT
jgi:hypothetical protein